MAAIKGQPGTKPTALAKPVPSAEAQSVFDQALAEGANNPPTLASNSGSVFDQAAMDSGQGQAQDQSAPSQQPGMLATGLDYAGRALNELGGGMRAGLFSAASVAQNAMQGKLGDVVTPEDLKNAAVGKGPSSAEYLKRMGVSEGGSLTVPGLGRVTLRGAEGLALDVLTDPLTQVAKAVKSAPVLSKLFNAPGEASDALGQAVYKSAFPAKAKDAASAMMEGVPEVGLAPSVPVGGTAKLAQAVEDTSNTIGKLRQGLYDRAANLGVTVDTGFPLTRAEAVLSRMNKDPGLQPAAEELGSLLDRYKSAGKVPLDVLSEWKTNLYDSLPQSAWGRNGLRGFAKQFKGALAGDFREAIVKAGNAAEPGLGDSIEALNNKWGALLSATRPLERAQQAAGGNLGRMIDGAVLATGGIKGEVIKKGYELATSPYAKTLVGKALMSAGKDGLATGLVNQGVVRAAGAPANSPDEGQ